MIKSVEYNLGEFPERQEFICPCNNLLRKWDIWLDTGEIKSGKTMVSMPLETIQEAEYVQDETWSPPMYKYQNDFNSLVL